MKRILVADDDATIRALVRDMFGLRGYEVNAVADGQEALDFLDELGEVDLLHTDIEMPRLSGYSLIRGLTERGLEIPVMVCSSGFVRDAIDYAGTLIYLSKPFDVDTTLAEVERLIGAP